MDSAEVKRIVAGTGAVAVGIAAAAPVSVEDNELYDRWIASGRNAGMNYMAGNADVRRNPEMLLEGVRSIIVAAYRYTGSMEPSASQGGLRWARYATGRDYHEVLRERLSLVSERIRSVTGAMCRVTVDTAPLRERYWAVQAGIGFTGLNGQLFVPGAGSMAVIGSVLTTLSLAPDEPDRGGCLQCGRCVASCPGQALDGKGGVDARRCLSYLTIESRAEDALDGEAGRWVRRSGRVYGCDVCQEVCPLNAGAHRGTVVADFAPREAIMRLTREGIEEMRQEDFSRTFSHTAVKRAKLSGLQRNVRAGRGE